MAIKYRGLLRFTDEIKAEIDLAADGTVEKAVVIDGEGAETPIGGGGSSDFTTAEVTITNNTGNSIELTIPTVEDGSNQSFLNAYANIHSNESYSCIVALYKGKTQCFALNENLPVPVCTGGVEDGGHGYYFITGNGTITFGTASEG